VVNGLPVDIIPSRVLRMILVTAQECDVHLGVLNGENIAKRLRFEETETEREVQESTRECIEAGAECRATAEGEQSSFDLERLERAHRERTQEMQGDGASATVLRGHVYRQGLDELQRTCGRKSQVAYPFLSVDSEHDIPEKVHMRAASPRLSYQSAVLERLIRDGGHFASPISLERWSTDLSVTTPNVIDNHIN
jgi:hypothetical protein